MFYGETKYLLLSLTILGSETNLCIMKKENDEYNYYHLQKTLLPTFSCTSGYMELVLEQMISFRVHFYME